MVGKAFPGRVIFDHQPKTGGMAIANWLREALGTGSVTKNTWGEHRSLIQTYGGTHSIIAAHVRFDGGDNLDPRYQYITCLREPIDRALSWIFHVLHDANLDENSVGLKKAIPVFLESDGEICTPELLQTIQNIYVRHFCRINTNDPSNLKDKLNYTISILKNYDAVGIYEELDSFLIDVASLIGVPAPDKLKKVNVTTKRPHVNQITPALRQRLIAWNELDIKLYAEVIRLKMAKNDALIPRYLPYKSFRWEKFDRKQSIIRRAPGCVVLRSPITRMKVAERVNLSVQVYNKSDERWLGQINFPVVLSYHWETLSGEIKVFEGLRTQLSSEGIPPGGSQAIMMPVLSPDSPGSYTLILTLLQEGSAWFESIGFEPGRFLIHVE